MAEMWWSLAKAASWVLERRTGVAIPLDADDSVVMLMDRDSTAPINAATEAISDLLAKLVSGDIPASGQLYGTGELVDIPAREWAYLRISPSLEGDRLEMRDGRVDWENHVLAYRNVRVVPEDVRKVWPHHQRGQRPQLRSIAGGLQTAHIVPAVANVPVPTVKPQQRKSQLTPTEKQIQEAFAALAAADGIPAKAMDRNSAVRRYFEARNWAPPSNKTIERFIAKTS